MRSDKLRPIQMAALYFLIISSAFSAPFHIPTDKDIQRMNQYVKQQEVDRHNRPYLVRKEDTQCQADEEHKQAPIVSKFKLFSVTSKELYTANTYQNTQTATQKKQYQYQQEPVDDNRNNGLWYHIP